ncbi:hypothetical protein BC833DRAFT_591684 [Globomyces pollinis-pini]|nr:hypothetical protein BC833DRAFT_591684 [Globomyces pollinis-pini]
MKVFVQSIDAPFGHNLADLLSKTLVGSRHEEEVEEEEDQLVETNPDALNKTEKPPKEPYVVVGTFLNNDESTISVHSPIKHPAKPGKMIETGDKKKDASRREAIERIPIVGTKPKSVTECVPTTDIEQAKRLLLESDVIVYDLLTNLEEANWALNFLAPLIDTFEKPKIFVAISTVMTWAKTKLDSEESETPFAEDEYRRRKPHPNFKNHLSFEKLLVKYSKKEKFKGFVIASGLVYHSGDSIFHYLFKSAWHNDAFLPCYGEGANTLPCIHLDDLISITVDVIEATPETKYILAVDESKHTLFEITKAIAESLSNGVVKKVTKEELFLDKQFSQADYDMLTVNLRMDPAYIKDIGLEWKYESGLIENLQTIIQEYKDARGLWALKIVMHGPPASGKSYFAQKVAQQYQIHYLEADEIVQQALTNLEQRVNGTIPNPEGDEVDLEADKELLNDLKESMKANNGKLPMSHTISFVRDKIRSMPCRNQGYILDGYPSVMDEAQDIFKPSDDDVKEDRLIPAVDDQVSPEFVFTIDASDQFIKQRVMKLPESAVAGTKNSEEALTKRLEEYRKNNTDEATVLNYFDELEIGLVTLQTEIMDASTIFDQIQKELGTPRNYGPSPEQIANEKREAEIQRLKAEAIATEERKKREQEEFERHKKVTAEWNARIEQVRKQEQEVLEIQSEPLRNYLVKYVMPTLTAGLIEVAKVRPEDPIDYLAEYLFKQNPENNTI